MITGSTISNNTAQSGHGGARGAGGLNNGDARDSWGGGISSDETGASLTVNTSTISGNKTIADTAGNKAVSFGGGIYSSQSFNAYEITVSKNSATWGGGIYLDESTSSATIVGATISGNTARGGGGLQQGNSGTLTIQDSTIAKNSAADSGGGFNLLGGSVTIHNDTVADNKVTGAKGSGGGVDVYHTTASVSIISSILAGNSAHTGKDLISASSTAVTASFDLIEATPTTGSYTNGGNNILGVNPLLGALASNGGLTLTMLPKSGSPVINTGDNPDSLTTDQRGTGFARTVGTGIGASDGTDIGAVEVQ
jgi:hypothetical protein